MKKVARALQRYLNKQGYELRWKPDLLLGNSSDELKMTFPFVAAYLTLQKKDIFFLEIGANDGIANDPVFPFVRDCNWSGLMVEPLPDVFANLVENLAEYPAVTPVNCAVAAKAGKQTFYTVDMTGINFNKAHQFSSFRRDILESQTSWVPNIKDRVVECEVDCLTLNDVLEKYGGGRDVDVIQIDTEGFDLEILKMIDFNKLNPAMINFESQNLTKTEVNEASEILHSNGYVFAMGDSDIVALNMQAIPG